MGQDLNLAMDRVLSSRNFANKLWNAGKFILSNLGGSSGGEESSNGSGSGNSSGSGSTEWQSLAQADFSGQDSLQGLPLTERWILSSLHQVSSYPQFLLCICRHLKALSILVCRPAALRHLSQACRKPAERAAAVHGPLVSSSEWARAYQGILHAQRAFSSCDGFTPRKHHLLISLCTLSFFTSCAGHP
jgi:hypothetical protein